MLLGLILFAIFVLYSWVGVWLLYFRWPLRAGLALAAISLLPLLIPESPESEVPGAGLPTALLMIPALSLIAIGSIAAVGRLALRLLKTWRKPGLQKT